MKDAYCKNLIQLYPRLQTEELKFLRTFSCFICPTRPPVKTEISQTCAVQCEVHHQSVRCLTVALGSVEASVSVHFLSRPPPWWLCPCVAAERLWKKRLALIQRCWHWILTFTVDVLCSLRYFFCQAPLRLLWKYPDMRSQAPWSACYPLEYDKNITKDQSGTRNTSTPTAPTARFPT